MRHSRSVNPLGKGNRDVEIEPEKKALSLNGKDMRPLYPLGTRQRIDQKITYLNHYGDSLARSTECFCISTAVSVVVFVFVFEFHLLSCLQIHHQSSLSVLSIRSGTVEIMQRALSSRTRASLLPSVSPYSSTLSRSRPAAATALNFQQQRFAHKVHESLSISPLAKLL